jgi:hypothetical protein
VEALAEERSGEPETRVSAWRRAAIEGAPTPDDGHGLEPTL